VEVNLLDYKDLKQEQKWYVNGVIGKYMDSYIRDHLVWTPEQMYHDFIEYLKGFHNKGWYGKKSFINGEWVFENKEEELWMVSEDAKEYIMSRFQKKYEKNQKLARKKGPLLDRIRLGLKWNKDLFFDINYGLYKGTHNYIKTEIVEGEKLIPWTIAHVNKELEEYNTDLPSVLRNLSTSYIEKKFYEYWIENYYRENSMLPAIIPEICGTRSMFYCIKCNGHYYLKVADIEKSERQKYGYKQVNVRFDFAIINWYKQKMVLIELDGHDTHKTVSQRTKDAVKRSIATAHGFHLNVFTGTQINRNIEACFDSIHSLLTKD
jgi:hypothetical protein